MSATTPPTDDREMTTQPAAPSERPAAEATAAQEGEGERPRGGGRGRGRDRDGDRDAGRRGDRDRRARRPRRKVCAFCVDKVTHIDYKDHARLRDFISDHGKILKSRMTGTCARHQRSLSQAIKRARAVALLPFVAE